MRAVPTVRLGFTVERSEGGLVAVCSCGWESGIHRAGGLVGALWDRHVEADHGAVTVAHQGMT